MSINRISLSTTRFKTHISNLKNETQFFKHDNIYNLDFEKFLPLFLFQGEYCVVFCCFVILISIQARTYFHVCQNSNTRRSEMCKQNGDWANSLPVKEWIDKRITKFEFIHWQFKVNRHIWNRKSHDSCQSMTKKNYRFCIIFFSKFNSKRIVPF